ncbi:peptidoglycan/LPS O-acetylase OafA/YrhL [Sphingobacterium allocomposti]|uniref:Peptidoglycan/LPS O-acetylase OafA/YrhL n=1 Tax=Sphingobacterium allocomposti TaxID=415956 RepID=A0A5S5DHJ7_9SPHI|nr:acyltransferase family protein [Sphingobacterium composti Yoo et al. 2007 non Ten et al. 2007]TYP94646.1 peptidoglycan/LPS O-acetylase OafA/YrhL [Sphingobacterium composti Yoo et al. 2007 non Ten et al. 2007]
MKSNDTKFRYDIAFLRSVAVLAVILYHLQVPGFSIGFIGVDIFFVLSGYLMTKIILGGLDNGTFQLLDFYRRRTFRIYPALLLVVATFFIILYFVLPVKLYDYSRFGLSSSLFVSNVYYYLSSGYFQPAAQLNFLLHTWSLSVEWQFYILYPLLLMGWRVVAKRKKVSDGILLLALVLLSFLSMLYFSVQKPSFAFYMLPTRVWEFVVGGLVVLYEGAFVSRLTQRVRNILALCCLMVLTAAIVGGMGISGAVWPSAWAAVPVLATGGILIAQPDLKIFRSRLTTYVGAISYSWYLWHWPIIVIAVYFGVADLWACKLAIFLLSFALATGSYYGVERSVLSRQLMPLSALAAVVIVGTFLGTRISLLKSVLKEDDQKLAGFFHAYPRTMAPDQFGFDRQHLLSRKSFDGFDTTALFRFSETQQNYLLLGDCHAGMFAHTLRKLARNNNVNLIQATGDETFPSPGVTSVFAGPTDLMNYVYNRYLPRHAPKIDKVILSANYAGYTKHQVATYLDSIERYFQRLQIPVVYIGQTEAYTVEYPAIENLRRKFGVEPQAYLVKYRTKVNSYLKNSSISNKYIDVYQSPLLRKGDGAETYMYDADHFSIYGTDQYAELFQKRIFEEPAVHY